MNLGDENEYVEHKEGLGQLDKGLKSLAAMLNRHGRGTVYFGVKDNGDVCGTSIGKKTVDDIRQRTNELIQPRIVIDLAVLADGDKSYIKLSAQGSDAPYSCDGRYFIRNVRSDDRLENEEIRQMLTEGKVDLIREAESDLQNLSFSQLCTYLAARGIHAEDKPGFHKSKGLLNKQGKFNLMAYLLSDQSEVSIKVVEFSGTDKTAMAKRTEYGNRCLILAADEVQRYIRSLNTNKTVLSNGERVDIPLFSFDAFHEAWINACAHNEWIAMVPPAVFIFDDRIEVVSYGPLPRRLSKEEFYEGTSKPVNEALLSIFIAAGLAEETGHGIPEIIKECGIESIAIQGTGLKVTLPFRYESERSERRKAEKRHNLSKTHMAVLMALQESPSDILSSVAKKTGLSLATVKTSVSYLQEIGAIRRIGSKKSGHWEINAD